MLVVWFSASLRLNLKIPPMQSFCICFSVFCFSMLPGFWKPNVFCCSVDKSPCEFLFSINCHYLWLWLCRWLNKKISCSPRPPSFLGLNWLLMHQSEERDVCIELKIRVEVVLPLMHILITCIRDQISLYLFWSFFLILCLAFLCVCVCDKCVNVSSKLLS